MAKRNLHLEIDRSCNFESYDESQIQKLVHLILAAEKITKTVNLMVIFVDNAYIIQLHEQFFQKRTVTDVVSFNLEENENSIEGEIYINVDQAKIQAEDYGVSFSQEMFRLIAHGLLHILGHTDHEPADKDRMTHLEDTALQQLSSE